MSTPPNETPSGPVIDEFNGPNVSSESPMDPLSLDKKRPIPTHIVSIKPDAPPTARFEVEALVTGEGNQVIDDFPSFNMFSAILTPTMVEKLLKHKYVKNVAKNGRSFPQAT